jgi:Tfp pilus assembly protein PilW
LAAAGAYACGAPKPEVEIASSAGEAGYAAAYPERFAEADKGLDATAAEARTGMAELAGFPAQISDSDWNVVRGAYERADTAGRGRAYAEGIAEDRAVRAFFDDERDDLGRRITGAVNSTVAKEVSDVEIDVSGTVAFALKDGVSKRLEKRLDGTNEAQLYLERQGKAVGKKDVDMLTEQINKISRVCFSVYVTYAEQRVRLARMRAEAKDVADTLDAEIESEGARCNDPALEKDDKKACEQRVADLMTSRASLDQVTGAYTRTEDGMLAEQDKLMKEYKEALGALLDAVETKIKETPPPPPAK